MITLHGEEVKVGDKVWHWYKGWGEVKDIDEERSYPIRVQWEDDYNWFTEDGKFLIREETPTIFWQPIEFEIPKKPKPKKPTEKAWQWICRGEGSHYFFMTSGHYATKEEAEASGVNAYGYSVVEPYLPSEIEREKSE